MSHSLIVEPEAEAEIDEASQQYETISSELGKDFLGAVEEALASIQENPLQYQVVYGNGHRVRMRRFPYRLVYVAKEREVVVLACIHDRRNPRRWQDRIP